MAVCTQSGHRGEREVHRLVIFYREDQRIEGCRQCVDGLLTPVFSTEKRARWNPATGKTYNISAAHVRHIRLRKIATDGRTVYQNRRGNVT